MKPKFCKGNLFDLLNFHNLGNSENNNTFASHPLSLLHDCRLSTFCRATNSNNFIITCAADGVLPNFNFEQPSLDDYYLLLLGDGAGTIEWNTIDPIADFADCKISITNTPTVGVLCFRPVKLLAGRTYRANILARTSDESEVVAHFGFIPRNLLENDDYYISITITSETAGYKIDVTPTENIIAYPYLLFEDSGVVQIDNWRVDELKYVANALVWDATKNNLMMIANKEVYYSDDGLTWEGVALSSALAAANYAEFVGGNIASFFWKIILQLPIDRPFDIHQLALTEAFEIPRQLVGDFDLTAKQLSVKEITLDNGEILRSDALARKYLKGTIPVVEPDDYKNFEDFYDKILYGARSFYVIDQDENEATFYRLANVGRFNPFAFWNRRNVTIEAIEVL